MDTEQSLMTIRALAARIAEGDFPRRSGSHWGFADTLIAEKIPQAPVEDWRPAPRYFITPHAPNMAWLFSELAAGTRGLPGYGLWKEEFFGRLGNAGNSFTASEPTCTAQQLGLAVTLEAFMFIDKTKSPDGFEVLAVSTDNAIADDAWGDLRTNMTTWTSVRESWAQLGLQLP